MVTGVWFEEDSGISRSRKAKEGIFLPKGLESVEKWEEVLITMDAYKKVKLTFAKALLGQSTTKRWGNIWTSCLPSSASKHEEPPTVDLAMYLQTMNSQPKKGYERTFASWGGWAFWQMMDVIVLRCSACGFEDQSGWRGHGCYVGRGGFGIVVVPKCLAARSPIVGCIHVCMWDVFSWIEAVWQLHWSFLDNLLQNGTFKSEFDVTNQLFWSALGNAVSRCTYHRQKFSELDEFVWNRFGNVWDCFERFCWTCASVR
jgi:hypothetical protein